MFFFLDVASYIRDHVPYGIAGTGGRGLRHVLVVVVLVATSVTYVGQSTDEKMSILVGTRFRFGLQRTKKKLLILFRAGKVADVLAV